MDCISHTAPRPATTRAAEALRPYLVAPLIVFIAALILFRSAAAVGISPLADWPTAARFALAVMFAFTAVAHFGRQRQSLVRMVPTWMPRPSLVVSVTGGLELLGAIGLLLPIAASLAGLCLSLLLVAMFPANIHAARQQVMVGDKPATPLWFRTLVQIVFVAALLWAAL